MQSSLACYLGRNEAQKTYSQLQSCPITHDIFDSSVSFVVMQVGALRGQNIAFDMYQDKLLWECG